MKPPHCCTHVSRRPAGRLGIFRFYFFDFFWKKKICSLSRVSLLPVCFYARRRRRHRSSVNKMTCETGPVNVPPPKISLEMYIQYTHTFMYIYTYCTYGDNNNNNIFHYCRIFVLHTLVPHIYTHRLYLHA